MITPNIRQIRRLNRQQLRVNATPAEQCLWGYICRDKLGIRFRRQVSISRYVVDFCAKTIRLVIEIDGSVHQDERVKSLDTLREKEMIAWGFCVLRFTNDEVFNKPGMVLGAIREAIKSLASRTSPSSSPYERRGTDSDSVEVSPFVHTEGTGG